MSAPAKGYVYTDSDGTVMQWDAERRCYFPKASLHGIQTNKIKHFKLIDILLDFL